MLKRNLLSRLTCSALVFIIVLSSFMTSFATTEGGFDSSGGASASSGSDSGGEDNSDSGNSDDSNSGSSTDNGSDSDNDGSGSSSGNGDSDSGDSDLDANGDANSGGSGTEGSDAGDANSDANDQSSDGSGSNGGNDDANPNDELGINTLSMDNENGMTIQGINDNVEDIDDSELKENMVFFNLDVDLEKNMPSGTKLPIKVTLGSSNVNAESIDGRFDIYVTLPDNIEYIGADIYEECTITNINSGGENQVKISFDSLISNASESKKKNHNVYFYVKFPNGITEDGTSADLESVVFFNDGEISDEIYSDGRLPLPLTITAKANALAYGAENEAVTGMVWMNENKTVLEDVLAFEVDLQNLNKNYSQGQIFTEVLSFKDTIELPKELSIKEDTVLNINGYKFIYDGKAFAAETGTMMTLGDGNNKQTWEISSIKHNSPLLGFIGSESLEIEFSLISDEKYIYKDSGIFKIRLDNLDINNKKLGDEFELIIKNDVKVDYVDYFGTADSYDSSQAIIKVVPYGMGAGEEEVGSESARLRKNIHNITGNSRMLDEVTGEVSFEKVRYSSSGESTIEFKIEGFGNYQNDVIDEIIITEELDRSFSSADLTMKGITAGHFRGIESLSVKYYYSANDSDEVQVIDYPSFSNTAAYQYSSAPTGTYKVEIILKNVKPNAVNENDGGFEILTPIKPLFKINQTKVLEDDQKYKVISNEAFMSYTYTKADGKVFNSKEIKAEASVIYELPETPMLGINKLAKSITNNSFKQKDENGVEATPFYGGNVVEYTIVITNTGIDEVAIPYVSDYMPTDVVKGTPRKYAAFITSGLSSSDYRNANIWEDAGDMTNLNFSYSTTHLSGNTNATGTIAKLITPKQVTKTIESNPVECYEMVFDVNNLSSDPKKVTIPVGKDLVIKYVVELEDDLASGTEIVNMYVVSDKEMQQDSGEGSGNQGGNWDYSGSSKIRISEPSIEIAARIYHKELNPSKTEYISIPTVKFGTVGYVMEADYVKMHGANADEIGGMYMSLEGYGLRTLDTAERAVKIIKDSGETIDITNNHTYYGRTYEKISANSWRNTWCIKYPLEEGDTVRIEFDYVDKATESGESALVDYLALDEVTSSKEINLTIGVSPIMQDGLTPYDNLLYKLGYDTASGGSNKAYHASANYPTKGFSKALNGVASNVANTSKVIFIHSQEESLSFDKKIYSIDGVPYQEGDKIELPSGTVIEYELSIKNTGSKTNLMFYDMLPPGQSYVADSTKTIYSSSNGWTLKRATASDSKPVATINDESFKRTIVRSETWGKISVPADGWAIVRYQAKVEEKGVILANDNPKNAYSDIMQLLEVSEKPEYLNEVCIVNTISDTTFSKQGIDGTVKYTYEDLASEDDSVKYSAEQMNIITKGALKAGNEVFYANAKVEYDGLKIRPGIEKTASSYSGGRVSPTNIIPWNVKVSNDSMTEMKGFVVVDVLPANMFLSGNMKYTKPATIVNDPTFRVIPWEDDTTLLVWEFSEEDGIKNGDSLEISYETKIDNKELLGDYTNFSYVIPKEVFVKAMTNEDGNLAGNISQDVLSADIKEIDTNNSFYGESVEDIEKWKNAWGSSISGELKGVYDYASVQVFDPEGLSGRKFVKTADSQIAASLQSVDGYVGETVTYVLELEAGTKSADISHIMDILPYKNDSATHTGQKRDSAYAIDNAQNVRVSVKDQHGETKAIEESQYSVKFAQDAEIKGIWDESDEAWHDSVENNGALLITFSDLKVATGSTLIVEFDADLPKEYVAGLEKGSIAWNSFAYRYSLGDQDVTLEAVKTGVRINYEHTGEITIKKEVILHKSADKEARDNKFYFNLLDENSNVLKFNELGELDENGTDVIEVYVEEKGLINKQILGEKTLKGLPPGKYTVKEISSEKLLYAYDVTIDYNNGTEKHAEIANGGKAEINVLNDEHQSPGELTINKEVVLLNALAEDAELTDSIFTFTVYDIDNNIMLFDEHGVVSENGAKEVLVKVEKDENDFAKASGNVTLSGLPSGYYTVVEEATGLALEYEATYTGVGEYWPVVSIELDKATSTSFTNTEVEASADPDLDDPTDTPRKRPNTSSNTPPPPITAEVIEELVDIEEERTPLSGQIPVDLINSEPVPSSNREEEELPKTGDDSSDMANMGFGAMFVSMMGAFFALLFKKKRKKKSEEDWD